MSFEELEHTADIRVRVEAPTIGELFSESARALMTIMYGSIGQGSIPRHLEMADHDLASLVHGFLSELLFISEVEDLVITDARVSISGNRLSANLLGEPFSREKHTGGREVKGISFPPAAIAREQDSYILELIFDV